MSTQDELAGLSDAVREVVAIYDREREDQWPCALVVDWLHYDTLRAELIRLSKPVADEEVRAYVDGLRSMPAGTTSRFAAADMLERLARRVQELESAIDFAKGQLAETESIARTERTRANTLAQEAQGLREAVQGIATLEEAVQLCCIGLRHAQSADFKINDFVPALAFLSQRILKRASASRGSEETKA